MSSPSWARRKPQTARHTERKIRETPKFIAWCARRARFAVSFRPKNRRSRSDRHEAAQVKDRQLAEQMLSYFSGSSPKKRK
jgi:hypothetical protein